MLTNLSEAPDTRYMMAVFTDNDYRYLQQIPNECLCFRCGDVYRKPRRLGCSHMACSECVKEMYEYEGKCGICNVAIEFNAVRSCKWSCLVLPCECDDMQVRRGCGIH